MDKEQMYTLDKSSSYLGETNRKDLLLSVKGSKKRLSDHSRQVFTTTTGAEPKRRSLGYTLLSNPLYLDIWLSHLVDRAFNGTEPTIVQLKHHFYVIIRENDLSAEVESNVIIKELIVPYIIKKRDDRCDEHHQLNLREISAGAPNPQSELPPIRIDGGPCDKYGSLLKLIILYLDGEFNNLNTLVVMAADYTSEQLIEIIKLAAACSKTQQPADVMKTFLLLHQFYYGEQFLNFDINSKDFNLPEFMHLVEEIIKPCDAADKEIFRKYFATLEHVRDFAVNPNVIKRGWANGLWPPSPRRIMALWEPNWIKFTPLEQDYVLECVQLVANQIIGINVNNNQVDGDAPFVIG